jgi:hypothetical protein
MRARRACRRGQPSTPDGDGARATSALTDTQRRLPPPARDEGVAIHLPQRFALEEENTVPASRMRTSLWETRCSSS